MTQVSTPIIHGSLRSPGRSSQIITPYPSNDSTTQGLFNVLISGIYSGLSAKLVYSPDGITWLDTGTTYSQNGVYPFTGTIGYQYRLTLVSLTKGTVLYNLYIQNLSDFDTDGFVDPVARSLTSNLATLPLSVVNGGTGTTTATGTGSVVLNASPTFTGTPVLPGCTLTGNITAVGNPSINTNSGSLSCGNINTGGTVTSAGNNLSSAAFIGWSSRSRIFSSADGSFHLTNQFGTSSSGTFTALGFGYLASTNPALYVSSTTLKCRLGDNSDDAPFSAAYVSFKVYTVATLPASPPAYTRAFVSDATANTYGATPTGGGSTKAPVWYNGAAWVIG